MNSEWIVPDWPAPPNVRSLLTTREGGVSIGPYASLNLGQHVGDDPLAVATNRARLSERVTGAGEPLWLEQVHGTHVVDAATFSSYKAPPQADAAFSRSAGVVCVVLTADCLPVLFCDDAGSVVAVAHAGWRGLLAGILEETMVAMDVPGRALMAYLGPAIGPQAFVVGDEVRSAFVAVDAQAATAFTLALPGKWLADIYLLARQRLAGQGVERIFGGSYCTFSEADRFFSYRRDGETGRMAALIWLDRESPDIQQGITNPHMDMKAIQTFFNGADAFARHNGMTIAEVQEGYARAEMEVQPYHLNGARTVHGGALFTLADFAFAAASNSRGQLALSINSSISIFKGTKAGKLIAEAREVSHSPKLASFEVSIRNQAGDLLATFQGMVYRKSLALESLLPG